jgi:hypothetical protein
MAMKESINQIILILREILVMANQYQIYREININRNIELANQYVCNMYMYIYAKYIYDNSIAS